MNPFGTYGEIIPMEHKPVPIDGGWHIKDLSDGNCIDVLQMIYNYRVVLSDSGYDGTPHMGVVHGWCYFGHGQDEDGKPRNMTTALVAAMLAAQAWDGEGSPAGYDKQAC